MLGTDGATMEEDDAIASSVPVYRLQIRWTLYSRLVGNPSNIICTIETGKEIDLIVHEGILIEETTKPDLLLKLLIIVLFLLISNPHLCR